MVVASVSMESIKHDLKSLPGGWVELRPMPYGQMLTRQENALQNSIKGDPTKISRSSKDQVELIIKAAQRATQIYEFKHCITDHNLEESIPSKHGHEPTVRKFDFKSDETAIDRLNPKIGAEIGELIDAMNQLDEEPEEADGSGN